ncbi:methyltransferase-like 26 [Clupea harengus]|uniref:Methyltransferase-like 26 n=1 Tax=Clupea harengus TaxID=7950 RepID=A0A6P8EPD2_CLUHA|nr:methyltransferase-like 26 [Clupea harengus]
MLCAAAAERNKEPISSVLRDCIEPSRPLKALEISSGSGQHIVHFAQAFKNVTWQPSDVDVQSISSIQAYRNHLKLDNVKSAIHLDASQSWENWSGFEPDSLDIVINLNMIHISPIACTKGLFKGAGVILKPQGLLLTYGV